MIEGNPTGPRRQPSSFPLPFALRSPRIGPRTSRVAVRASIRRVSQAGNLGGDVFENLSSGSGQQTYTSVGKPNLPMPPPPSSSSNVGSPLFWIGVCVGFSAIFSFNKQFGNAASPSGSPFPLGSPFPPGSPFSYPPPQASSTTPSAASQSTVTVNVPATKVKEEAVDGGGGKKRKKDEERRKRRVGGGERRSDRRRRRKKEEERRGNKKENSPIFSIEPFLIPAY
ncbi:hypothetical protein ACOSP7_014058 [Xanthoceras sorbifolium]